MTWVPWLCLALILGACGDNAEGEDRQGGDTTVDNRSWDAFRQPAANLSAGERNRFQAGRSPFDFRWDAPQLGTLFNNVSCLGCHAVNGRGASQIGMGPASQALVRVSLSTGDPGDPGGPIPLPGYGTQLQDHATVGLPEVRVMLTWIETSMMYDDGELIAVREPRLDIVGANSTPLPQGTRFSYRTAPPVIGLGLLEAIPQSTLEALADPDDADLDGISGRTNQVWDPEKGATVMGRFGWKANTSTLHLQCAAAAANDIGLSNAVFPELDQQRDLNDQQLEDMVFFMATVGVPAAAPRDAKALHGRALFRDFGCASCHVPTLETGDHPIAAVANQRIHPYTDLLLHDVGDRLTDARPDFVAEGVEWRTPPLWGIGLTKTVFPMATYLHDGRARSLDEAILWHGGEAMSAREAFRTANREDRIALIAFLETL
ncbi:MAG TPA: di-heme oxidoredictase family protein [Kofleriaceae bacterium]|nr:di-heme oxidoredictase family protein [Kofleriaceae bacterium]